MKLKLFAVRDAKAEAFIPPFVLPNEAMAVREFTGCANDPTHAFCRNSDDYSLYEVGEFDDATGVLTVPAEPRFLVKASSLRKQVELPLLDKVVPAVDLRKEKVTL